MLNLILEHYPTMQGGTKMKGKISDTVGGISRVFSSKRPVGPSGEIGQSRVAFADFENVDNVRKLQEEMNKDEMASSKTSEPRKWTLMDRKAIREHRHVLYIAVNPADRKSKRSTLAKANEDYLKYRGDPAINQQRNAKEMLVKDGKDPDDGWIVEQQPMLPPGQGVQQPQPPTPQQNPMTTIPEEGALSPIQQ